MTSSERIALIERIVNLRKLLVSLRAAAAKKAIVARYESRLRRLEQVLVRTKQMRGGEKERVAKVIFFGPVAGADPAAKVKV